MSKRSFHLAGRAHRAQLTDKPMIWTALAPSARRLDHSPVSEARVGKYIRRPASFPPIRSARRPRQSGATDGETFQRPRVHTTHRACELCPARAAIGLGNQLIHNLYWPTIRHRRALARRFLKLRGKNRSALVLSVNDLREARRLVNGGCNGLAEFEAAYRTGMATRRSARNEKAIYNATASTAMKDPSRTLFLSFSRRYCASM